MNPDQLAAARACLAAAYDGSMSFPQILGRLIECGFEGYAVDYRRGEQVYYLPDGSSTALPLPDAHGPVAAAFDSGAIAALVRWAQADASDYSYGAFSARACAAGCAGYLVSFPGRRVLYYGRTVETHLELFPQQHDPGTEPAP
ncbi:MAG: DUF1398 domain-containing protein [Alphaproteobacteria bacterium]|nr:DUF1398 domain-containing protein [Alphaproteobacteria bacterium]